MNYRFYAPKITLRQFNNALSVVVIAAALYILVWPFLPQLSWWARHSAPVISSPVQNTVKAEPIPAENTLVIPKIDLRKPIVEGQGVEAVDKGVWRRPLTAKPSQPGNTVLVGHRFEYGGQKYFYHLDKMAVGDLVRIYWEGKTYDYKVAAVKVVPATEISVEGPTNDRLLTLYTCTPLWSAKDRLVVQALPAEGSNR